jgi:hypothetical protein
VAFFCEGERDRKEVQEFKELPEVEERSQEPESRSQED